MIGKWYLYSLVIYSVATLFLLYRGVKTKKIDMWTKAGVVFLIGVSPFNTIVLGIIILFKSITFSLYKFSHLVKLIFYKLTKDE